jgi:hypothetical protein
MLTSYVGEFNESGEREGYGILQDIYGDTYEGGFLNNLPHGEGRLTSFMLMYTGEFYEGKFHGKGILEERNGNRYEGIS